MVVNIIIIGWSTQTISNRSDTVIQLDFNVEYLVKIMPSMERTRVQSIIHILFIPTDVKAWAKI